MIDLFKIARYWNYTAQNLAKSLHEKSIKMLGKSNSTNQINLFKSNFDQLLNPKHPLVILAKKIDWNRFETSLADCYCVDNSRPAKNIRLMVGLAYLKYTFSVSDENLPHM